LASSVSRESALGPITAILVPAFSGRRFLLVSSTSAFSAACCASARLAGVSFCEGLILSHGLCCPKPIPSAAREANTRRSD
jgi:hypothetical protein